MFVGPKGGRLRRSNFRKIWNKARASVGLVREVQQEPADTPGEQQERGEAEA